MPTSSSQTVLAGRYRIIRLLGQGGMSRVYLGRDDRLGNAVAIKENLQTSPEAAAQFEREGHILASLAHVNLPHVMDTFTDAASGRQYLVMEYVEGEDLEAMVKRAGPLPEASALAWLGQILDAVEYLHGRKPPVIHRDIKPANIKVTPQGRAVLVDFGISKVFQPGQSTITGARGVTPGYASPEQYGMHTDQRSDLYSLGATLYTLLTGKVPPDAPLRVSGTSNLVSPRQITPAVSPAVDRAIQQAMELRATARLQNVAAFRAALRGGGLFPGAGTTPPPIRTGFPVSFVGAAAGAIFLVIGAFAMTGGGPRATPTAQSASWTPTPLRDASPTALPVASTAVPARSPAPVGAVAATTSQPLATATAFPSPSPSPTPCRLAVDATFAKLGTAVRAELGCPTAGAVTLAWIAEEAFQGGHLFWRQDTDEVYVVYDRDFSGADRMQGAWALPAAKWDGSNPDGVGMSPPPGLVEPVRGFGWLWRTRLGGPGGSLGWALDKEYGRENVARYQRFQFGLAYRASDPKVYALLDSGRFVAAR